MSAKTVGSQSKLANECLTEISDIPLKWKFYRCARYDTVRLKFIHQRDNLRAEQWNAIGSMID